MKSLADWNDVYAGQDYAFGRAPSQFVARVEPMLARGSRVLCVADGEGRNSVFLARCGHIVEANDCSENALSKARCLAADAKVDVTFNEVDLMTWHWPEVRYDSVFAVFVQFAPPDLRDRMFAGLKTCVADDGLIFLHGYTPEQIAHGTGGPPNPEFMYTESLLQACFGDCQIEHLTSYEAELDEGPRHKGRSALIDLVARRRARAQGGLQ